MVLDDFLKGISTKAGVYQFYVYSLDKYYIGESVNIQRRVLQHLKGRGKKEIFNAVLKNGFEDIAFKVLQFEENEDRRLDLEEYFKNYHGYRRLLNLVEGKELGSGKRSLVLVDKEGNLKATYNSVSEAASLTNKDPSYIVKLCNFKLGFKENLFWFYENEYSSAELQNRLNKKEEKLNKRNTYNKLKGFVQSKAVLAVSIREEFIFCSIKDAARYFNLDFRRISDCCNNKLASYKNFKWSFINE